MTRLDDEYANRYRGVDFSYEAAEERETRRRADALTEDELRVMRLVRDATRRRTRLTPEELAALIVGQVDDPHGCVERLTTFPRMLTAHEGLAPPGHLHELTPAGERVLALLDADADTTTAAIA